MRVLPSMISGLVGAISLTLLHQLWKKTVHHAPAMDELGMEALEKMLSSCGVHIPSKKKLYNYTIAGDITGNAGYYSLVGLAPKHTLLSKWHGTGIGCRWGSNNTSQKTWTGRVCQ